MSTVLFILMCEEMSIYAYSLSYTFWIFYLWISTAALGQLRMLVI